MSTTDVVELVAWILAAIIGGWLLFDLVAVGRRYDEEFLTNPAEDMDHFAVQPDDGSPRLPDA